MSIRSEIEQHLSAAIKELHYVGGATELSKVTQSFVKTPATFVIPLRSEAGPNITLNEVSQRVIEYYGIIIVVKNYSDPRGTDSADQIDILRQKVREALLGWAPNTACPLVYVGGSILNTDKNFVFWEDDFWTAFHIDSNV